MNYEEKLREIVNSNTEYYPSEDKAVFAKYFPELKNDNERIRKGIIRNLQYLMDKSEGFVKEDLQERIVWLEKQDTNKEYVFRPVAGTMIENAVEQALKQGNVVLAFNGFYTSVKDKTFDEILVEYDSWIKRQGEQPTDKIEANPAWSEEDEEMLTWLCRIIHTQRLDRAITLKEESKLGEWIDKWLNHNPQSNQSEHIENYDEDERIRKGLIKAVSRIFEGHKLFDTDVTREEALAWLEKQEEPEDKGEMSDGYHTFNELYSYRMLYNAAFFNLLPKQLVYKSKRHHDGKECFGGGWFIVMANLPTGQISNHYELKDWDLFQIPEKEIADEWDGHTPQDATERLHKYLLEKQDEQKPNPYSGTSFEYNGHIWGMCARDNGVEILFDGELKAFLSLEKSFIYPIYPKPDLAHKSAIEVIKENVGNNNKVESKFKVGDWIVTDDSFGKIVRHVDEISSNIIDERYVVSDEYGLTYNISFDKEHKWHKWTIDDAKNGDVLVDLYSKDSFIILYKGIDKERNILAHCGWNGYYLFVTSNDGLGCGGLDNTDYLPATKEQRELLFEKMKQADYEWDAENKKLSKQPLKITPKFCVGQLITDDNGNWYKITNIKCLDDWYYELYDVCEDTAYLELCSIIDEKCRANSFIHEIKKMMGD